MKDIKSSAQEAARNIYRKSILQVAISILLQKGYHATTIQQISKVANVAPATIYRYFESKKGILGAIFELFWGMIYERVIETVPQIQTTKERLEAIIAAVIHVYENSQDLFDVILFNIPWAVDIQLYKSKQLANFTNFVRNIFQEGIAKGELKKVNYDALIELYIPGIEGFLRMHSFIRRGEPDMPFGINTSIEDLITVMNEALSPYYLEKS